RAALGNKCRLSDNCVLAIQSKRDLPITISNVVNNAIGRDAIHYLMPPCVEKRRLSKIRLSEKELIEGMTSSTVHADELANVTPVELSLEQSDSLTEEEKMKLVCYRFLDIKEDDLMEGDEFFTELDSGKYDEA
ncbi:hypothetical protein, partial [Vibrio anguillarum]|uniref:hypothetical protein n=1 Tax=Vibrio anguillarum TaxID=55601 RepID=UPI002E18A8E3